MSKRNYCKTVKEFIIIIPSSGNLSRTGCDKCLSF